MASKEANIPAVSPQVVTATDTQPETGAVRRDFLEAVVIALLAFSIGLSVGAALCISGQHRARPQEEQQWPN